MRHFSKKMKLAMIGLFLIPVISEARVMILDKGYGEEQTIEIAEGESLGNVVDYLLAALPANKDAIGFPRTVSMDIYVANDHVHMKAANKDFRNYQNKINKNDVDDITFILSTMAKSSLAGIATKRSDLKRAGERIEHLHPYRFLEIIFTNEELKAYVAAVRGRAFVWKEFLSGLVGSFEDEFKNKNVTSEQLKEFANKVGVEPSILQPYVKEQKWKDLVNKLIDTIPREGNPGRYDM